MNYANANQIRIIRSIIAIHGLEKEDVIYHASDGRTTSTRELYWHEADALIIGLNGKRNQTPSGDAENKMRRKIISFCHEMHMTKAPGKIDMVQVDELVCKFGHLKPKSLNQYKGKDLQTLVYVIQRIKDNYLKQQRKEYASIKN